MTLLARLLLAAATVAALAGLGHLVRVAVRLLVAGARRFRAADRATCSTCGGILGPVTVAVWGPEDGPADAETCCTPCHSAACAGNPAPYYPGVTAAPIGPVTTWGDFDAAARAAYPTRRVVASTGTGVDRVRVRSTVCADQGHDWRPQPGSGFWSECARCWTPVPTSAVPDTTSTTAPGQEDPR
jgi:hypothetical protein